jgi:prepilin-type N-terminal cleavage/methylation domain-containing protein
MTTEPKQKHRPGKPNGFSLIELLLAMALMGIMIIPLSRYWSDITVKSDAENNEAIASIYMEEGMKLVSLMGENNFSCTANSCTKYISGDGDSLVQNAPSGEAGIDDLFSRSVIIRPITEFGSGSLSPSAYHVTVMVVWEGSGEREHAVSTSRIIF